MNAVWQVPAVIALALLFVACVVFGAGDWSVLTPPPEARVEGFVRELVSGRYERARPYLSAEMQARLTEGDLRRLGAWLNRQGKVLEVRGEPGWVAMNSAEAWAVLRAAVTSETRSRFTLTRQQGVWAVSGLDEQFLAGTGAGGVGN